MLKKVFSKTGRTCRVTFSISSDVLADTAHLCGEFNHWSACTHPMKRLPDGSFALTLSLKIGREYRFRYILDGHRWINDHAADGYITNPYNNLDSIVRLEYAPKQMEKAADKKAVQPC